jgi:hypothetical protein
LVVEFAIFGWHYAQYLALHIRLACLGEELTDMSGDTVDIILQALYILKDVVVDALQEVRLAALNCGLEAKRLIDNADFDCLGQENRIL